ncbi:MAG TPA: hypothetical protein DF613_14740 [Lachnospiraceae bacterium]|nr:hypothetical protein [Lachnospiraceae bacterium]
MHKNEPLLSVIVPVYNAEKYISQCVNSILQQKHLALEIILVDDGSLDESGTICDLFAKKNYCVKALHIKNGGIAKARYEGIKIAKGRWVTFVDADDWISENAYRDICFEDDCDIVVTGICEYTNDGREIMHMPYFKEGIYEREEIVSEIIPIMLWNSRENTWALDPSLCTKFFRRKDIQKQLEKVSKVGSDFGEDSMVIYPMMFQVDRIRILKKIYYFHRLRPSGVLPPYIIDEEFIPKLYKVYEYLKDEFRKTAYWDFMKGQLDCFFINSIELKKHCFEYSFFEFAAFFPIEKVSRGSRVILYGAGELGIRYWKQNSLYHFCDIVSWVDRAHEDKQIDNCIIESPEVIKEREFEFVVIAVDNYYIAQGIVLYLSELGVGGEKIVWHSTRVNRQGMKSIFDILKKVSEPVMGQ